MSFVRLAPEQFDTIDGVAEPAENPVLVGHDDAIAHVAAAYRSGKMHHALLLSGPPGIGKATFAFHLAHHLLANPRSAEAPLIFGARNPESALFRQVAQGSHPGVLHLTRPMNDKTKAFKSVVTVDEIRKIGRFLSMTSHDGGWRVVIVDPADDMNTNAANALLKNLEEPPARTLFVLIAHSPGGLLPTIRSRCQTIKMKPLSGSQLFQVLETLGTALPEDAGARQALAERAGGSAREALMLTQYGGLDIADAINEIMRANQYPVTKAWRIAEAVAGKDNAVQFGIFNQTALDMIAGWATQSAVEGNLGAAAGFSDVWREAGRIVSETETYNLDKKQHVSGLLSRLWQALNA